jgi:L-ascorbate metabolism protein UlaG (beta-lactamase superfamily)
VGEAAAYEGLPEADLILITHEHGDHYNAEVLAAVKREETPMITNPAVFEMLPEALKPNTQALENGGSATLAEVQIEAIPAYNTTEGRRDFHPEGRDNGYVLSLGDFRIYVSGDTEDIPAMRELEEIDLAFVCMNLPFTMTAEAAADAVRAFSPSYVYPYHYRGRDGGTQDPTAFAEMVGDAAQVQMGDWYKPGELG